MTSLLLIAALITFATFGPPLIERCFAGPESDPFVFTPAQQDSYDEHVRQALRVVAPGAVVPMQRTGGEWS